MTKPPYVDPAISFAIRKSPGGFAMRVNAAGGEAGALERAISRATALIRALEGDRDDLDNLEPEDRNSIKFISTSVLGDQAHIYIDGGEVGLETLLSVPSLVCDALLAERMSDIAVMPADHHDGGLARLGGAVATVCLRPDPRQEPLLPEEWIRAAEEWVTAEGAPDMALVENEALSARLPFEAALDLLRRAPRRRYSKVIVAVGEPAASVRAAGVIRRLWPLLTVAAGGPALSEHEVADVVANLRRFVESLGQKVAHASIQVGGEGTLRFLSEFEPGEPAGYPNNLFLMPLADLIVHDAAFLTLLGDGHLARLREKGAENLLSMIGGDHWLQVGTLSEWLYSPEEAKQKARQRVSPLMARCRTEYEHYDHEFELLRRERPQFWLESRA